MDSTGEIRIFDSGSYLVCTGTSVSAARNPFSEKAERAGKINGIKNLQRKGVRVMKEKLIQCKLYFDKDKEEQWLNEMADKGWNMKKRFVVCYSDNIPKEKEMHFIQFIKDNKLGWWHWISNMWLLVDSSGQMTASILRDKICKLYSENRVMVIELDGDRDTWAGFGPTQPKNMFDWIKQNWGKD